MRHAAAIALAFAAALSFAPATARAGASAPADSLEAAAPANAAWRRGLLRADRLEHASLSFTLAAAAGIGGRARGEAFAFTIAIGTGKELHDGRHGSFDVLDLAADAVGAALGAWAAARR